MPRSTPVDQAMAAVAQALSRCRGPVEQLAACRQLARRLQGLQRQYAEHAARHYTWEEIAESLGISRQAAWKQYGPKARRRR
ncbi:MAG: hypothetical protein ACREMC_06345 [Gemmatimonadales bacterium]